ncbi:MAG: GPI inositol-deacylase [Bacteroidia bacterium]|nr:GPI inositol-deacylase [Bacteroidia bacterium]MCF8427297.1 GPI inositol-deacylase [Bacteroidia bacterium]MCF8447875.1 GPI inositol-deacylase [Bacteroidia bacterium]
MKNKYIVLIGFVSLLLISKISLAQTEAPDTTTVKFADEQALSIELQKYGLKIREFPTNDPCLRDGPAKIGKEIFWSPGYPQDENPVKKFGVDNTESWAPVTGDINIFWLHGLNGNTESLVIPAKATQFGIPNKFDARKARSYRGTSSSTSAAIQLYSEDAGITFAAGDLENYFNSNVPIIERTPRDFIIAHSQGGMVSREWLRKMEQEPFSYKNFAHGLVTIGSPHAGAQILNQVRPNLGNKIPAFMDEACKNLSKALIVPKVNSNLVTQLLISKKMTDLTISKGCDLISNTIIPFALDNYFKRTTEDFYVGSPFLTGYNDATGHVEGLSEYTLKVPVVQFYGVEEEPVMWRFMSSSLKIGEDILSNNQAAFGYDQDDQLQIKVASMINDFHANELLEKEQEEISARNFVVFTAMASTFVLTQRYAYGGLMASLASAALVKRNAANENKQAYAGAKVWLSNANEYYQADLLGLKTSTNMATCKIFQDLTCIDNRNPGHPAAVPYTTERTIVTTKSQCDPLPSTVSYANMQFTVENGKKLFGPCSGTQTVITYWRNVGGFKPNDGVVSAETASHKIKVNTDIVPKNTQYIGIMPRTNHDQMKNSDETRKALERLYAGECGEFFKLGKK